ncbi:WD40/YVTN/BNR-like repeat-containing protein [Marinicellulosiphila megalodicopiae]|uniref:WD40/YVTN/BNR-like repeat-containing protein n=1 Tax=Marinicellulosiphila megalodicopiae TaxID=2724896 RepID=UPI003BB1317B
MKFSKFYLLNAIVIATTVIATTTSCIDSKNTTNTNTNTQLNTAPIVANLNNIEATVGQTINLTPLIYDEQGDTLSYVWTINGESFNSETLQYQFSQPGSYDVVLTVYDNQTSTTKNMVVVVSSEAINLSPMITSINDVNVLIDETISISADASDPEGGQLSYSWMYEGQELSNESTLHYASSNSGEFSIVLTVKDAQGNQASEEFNITVYAPNQNQKPIIEQIADREITIGETLTITPNVNDPENGQLQYSWTVSNQNTQQFNYQFNTIGMVTVELTVIDDAQNKSTMSFVVNVVALPVNQAPEITAINDVNIFENENINITAIVNDNENDDLEFEWKLNNQIIATTNPINYQFVSAGQFTIELNVSDGLNTSQIDFDVYVNETPIPNADGYVWNPVVIKGGGFVSGLIYSKADPSILYARTDIGGIYRWNAPNKTWIPLNDSFTNGNDWGVWSVAADPSDANKVYMATGLYSADWGQVGSIFSSNDKGDSWTKVAAAPVKLGGNNPGRGNGEFLQVDPNKPNELLLGSKKDGLFKSTDSGASWNKVSSLNASYITFVEYDDQSGANGSSTPIIYVGVADYIYNGGNVGVYRSTDAGQTWSKLINHPAQMAAKSFDMDNPSNVTVPMGMARNGNSFYFVFSNTVTPDGDKSLDAAYWNPTNGAVFKFNAANNNWTDITPAGSANLQGGFASVDVSSVNPNIVMISTIGRWYPMDEIYFTEDGGSNWTSTFNSYNYASTWGNSLNKAAITGDKAPYADESHLHWPAKVRFNPVDHNEAMVVSGMGIYMSFDVSGLLTNTTANNSEFTTWSFENDGIEETAPLDLISPPGGAPLVSALGDIDGFRHDDLNVSPPAGRHLVNNSHPGTTRSIDFAQNSPDKIVMAYDNNNHNKGALSTDGGSTWNAFATKPSGVADNDLSGNIAISANGSTIVWGSQNATMAYSANDGQSWAAVNGLSVSGLKPVADRVNSNKFYAFDPATQIMYYSTNAASSFSSTALNLTGIPNYLAPQPEVKSVYNKEGDLWLANYTHGLYRSINSGTSFNKISGVTTAFNVAIGAPEITGDYPTVYIWGIIDGVNGIFRSQDEGVNWTQINDNDTQWAQNHSDLTASQTIFGRLFIALGGRGIIYGDQGCQRDNDGDCL